MNLFLRVIIYINIIDLLYQQIYFEKREHLFMNISSRIQILKKNHFLFISRRKTPNVNSIFNNLQYHHIQENIFKNKYKLEKIFFSPCCKTYVSSHREEVKCPVQNHINGSAPLLMFISLHLYQGLFIYSLAPFTTNKPITFKNSCFLLYVNTNFQFLLHLEILKLQQTRN